MKRLEKQIGGWGPALSAVGCTAGALGVWLALLLALLTVVDGGPPPWLKAAFTTFYSFKSSENALLVATALGGAVVGWALRLATTPANPRQAHSGPLLGGVVLSSESVDAANTSSASHELVLRKHGGSNDSYSFDASLGGCTMTDLSSSGQCTYT